jgi:hypothetical protein
MNDFDEREEGGTETWRWRVERKLIWKEKEKEKNSGNKGGKQKMWIEKEEKQQLSVRTLRLVDFDAGNNHYCCDRPTDRWAMCTVLIVGIATSIFILHWPYSFTA